MIDREAHCHLTTTIELTFSSESGALQLCSSSATLSASCGGDLGAYISQWVSVTLLGASAAGQGLWVRRQVSGFAFKV